MLDADGVRGGVPKLVELSVMLAFAVAAPGVRRQREWLQQRQRGHDRRRSERRDGGVDRARTADDQGG